MGDSFQCKLGCEIIHNFTLSCPGIEITFDPDVYAMVAGGDTCLEQCAYNNGTWWHYTDFTAYFSCFHTYAPNCDYWEIYNKCSPMRDEMLCALQALSFCCCVVLLHRLHKEMHKGMLQQSLFISIAHNLVQFVVSEQAYNLWAMYVIPKGDARSIMALSIRFAHVWIIFGSLVWSLVTAVILLRITEGQKRCTQSLATCSRHKTLIIVLFEFGMIAMSALSVVARIKVWNNFFLGFLVTCLVAVLAGVVCYIVPALRARSMQVKWAQSQLHRRNHNVHRKSVIELRAAQKRAPETRIQIKPFLLLLTVVVLTYIPFFVVYARPVSNRTRAGYLTAWSFLELVGVWNFIALLVVYFGRSKSGSSKLMRVWVRNDRVVGRGNLVVVGSHSFVRNQNQLFWRINPTVTLFGSGCVGEDLEEVLAGDIEQTSKGSLVRWIKRPSRFAHNSVSAVGLPLEKFQLFVDPQLASWFPSEVLQPLPSQGFAFAVEISSIEAEQRLQVQAVEGYEEVSLLWKTLHEDRANPSEDPVNQFEQAQLNWAYEEAVSSLTSAIEVLMRWRRSPVSRSGPSSSPRSDTAGTLLSQEEKKLWNEPLPTERPELSQDVLAVDMPDTTSETPNTSKETESRLKSETIEASGVALDSQMALFT